MKMPLLNSTPRGSIPRFHAIIDYDDGYVQPLVLSALMKSFPPSSFHLIPSLHELQDAGTPLLQISSYESLPFEHLLAHQTTSLGNAYVIRKALIRKHYLANTIATWVTKNPSSLLKTHFKPAVDFEVDYAEFLDEALVEAYELHESFANNVTRNAEEREWWILKPGMSDRGQGIRLFSTQEELQEVFEEWEGDESDENGADRNVDDEASEVRNQDRDGSQELQIITSQLRHFVAQRYIHPPLLLPAMPRKFHIRTYVLAVGSLRVYVYREMLALFAGTPYVPPWHLSDDGHRDLSAHLTNTCLQTTATDDKQTTNPDLVYSFWDLPSLLSPEKEQEDWKESIYSQILSITSEAFLAASRTTAVHFQTLPNAFEVFGLDFLVDAGGTAWLLEINAFPDFAQTGGELREKVVGGLWEGVMKVAVEGWVNGLNGHRAGQHFEPPDGRNSSRSEKDRKGAQEEWGMKKVLDIDLGRRA